jgi:hypothetical protein
MISMIRLAISKGIRFNYVLVDSWGTCFELVKFIVSRRIKYHFIGMIKMETTCFNIFGKNHYYPKLLKLKMSENLLFV